MYEPRLDGYSTAARRARIRASGEELRGGTPVSSNGQSLCRHRAVSAVARSADDSPPPALQPLKHNNPGLETDLGVGLWAMPMPMDDDRDGDDNLLVVSVGKPKNGIYSFENPRGDVKMPVFRPGNRIDKALQSIQGAFVGAEVGFIYDMLNPRANPPRK